MIPDYQTLMRSVLQQALDGEVRIADVVATLADEYALSSEEREQLLPIQKRGSSSKSAEPEVIAKDDSEDTPDEALRTAYEGNQHNLGIELLERVRAAPPAFFEAVIVKLLVAMGYGVDEEDSAQPLGQSGDGDVDGVINQDTLGVDQIYVQAKRYAAGNSVGSPAIRDFFGALNLKHASKGIFFTTSHFSSSAVSTANSLGTRIVLIEGDDLAKLLVRFEIGCREAEVLRLRKVDEDFFDSE